MKIEIEILDNGYIVERKEYHEKKVFTGDKELLRYIASCINFEIDFD